MGNKTNRRILLTIMAFSIGTAASAFSAYAKNALAVTRIENNVSSSSNTSGNSAPGSGSIETGDAVSKSKVKAETGGGEQSIEIKAEAKANDEQARIDLKKELDGESEDFTVQKEAVSDGGEARAQVDVSIDQTQKDQKDQKDQTENENLEGLEPGEEEAAGFPKGSLTELAKKISDLVGRIVTFFRA